MLDLEEQPQQVANQPVPTVSTAAPVPPTTEVQIPVLLQIDPLDSQGLKELSNKFSFAYDKTLFLSLESKNSESPVGENWHVQSKVGLLFISDCFFLSVVTLLEAYLIMA